MTPETPADRARRYEGLHDLQQNMTGPWRYPPRPQPRSGNGRIRGVLVVLVVIVAAFWWLR